MISAHTHQTYKYGQMKFLKQLKHVDKNPGELQDNICLILIEVLLREWFLPELFMLQAFLRTDANRFTGLISSIFHSWWYTVNLNAMPDKQPFTKNSAWIKEHAYRKEGNKQKTAWISLLHAVFLNFCVSYFISLRLLLLIISETESHLR